MLALLGWSGGGGRDMRRVGRYAAYAVKCKSGQAVMMADEFPLPKYARVVTELRRRIEVGEYGPGDMLPSEAQLVREFGIGRTTIVRALQMLQADGWITREHGLGSYVKARPAGERNSARLGRAVLELPETAPGFSLLHAGEVPRTFRTVAKLRLGRLEREGLAASECTTRCFGPRRRSR